MRHYIWRGPALCIVGCSATGVLRGCQRRCACCLPDGWRACAPHPTCCRAAAPPAGCATAPAAPPPPPRGPRGHPLRGRPGLAGRRRSAPPCPPPAGCTRAGRRGSTGGPQPPPAKGKGLVWLADGFGFDHNLLSSLVTGALWMLSRHTMPSTHSAAHLTWWWQPRQRASHKLLGSSVTTASCRLAGSGLPAALGLRRGQQRAKQRRQLRLQAIANWSQLRRMCRPQQADKSCASRHVQLHHCGHPNVFEVNKRCTRLVTQS